MPSTSPSGSGLPRVNPLVLPPSRFQWGAGPSTQPENAESAQQQQRPASKRPRLEVVERDEPSDERDLIRKDLAEAEERAEAYRLLAQKYKRERDDARRALKLRDEIERLSPSEQVHAGPSGVGASRPSRALQLQEDVRSTSGLPMLGASQPIPAPVLQETSTASPALADVSRDDDRENDPFGSKRADTHKKPTGMTEYGTKLPVCLLHPRQGKLGAQEFQRQYPEQWREVLKEIRNWHRAGNLPRCKSWINTKSKQCMHTYIKLRTKLNSELWNDDEPHKRECQQCAAKEQYCVVLGPNADELIVLPS
ncbi:uncharacterized protein J3D65DRAFT_661340 [Phyllosticta citribraziliensis]|uniref:Uncharacterized protein n=1 Tax=Phyllosticta citribraziliensis TaxID=989973 RepID=A0ABR1LA20_9PEZI